MALAQYKMVDRFLGNSQQLQGAQERRHALQELENGFSEVMLRAVHRDLQDNDQEFCPLLPELRQRVRPRFGGPSVPDPEDEGLRPRFGGPSVPDPEDEDDGPGAPTFWDRVLRWFQRMLRQLRQRWLTALAWLRQRAAAGWQAVCRAVGAVCSALADFCASLAQVFRSCTQA